MAYEDIKRTLGAEVPCYGDPPGCRMDDKADCTEGCLLLKVYRAGERAGRVGHIVACERPPFDYSDLEADDA
jgi:hypothetical protein